MNPSVKTNAVTKKKAVEIVGKDLVDDVLDLPCDFTGRVIDSCFGVMEMSATTENDKYEITVNYLIDSEQACNCDDMSNFDYNNYTFEIFEK